MPMRTLLLTLALSSFISAGFSQDTDSVARKKGSYLYYGQPNIEDNSMFIEEAFNQEKAIIQHISNFIFDDLKGGGDFVYGYTQEIPMLGDKHQFSFTLNYSVLDQPIPGFPSYGFGDILLNYRPMLMDKNDWALVIPRFTLIVPTGSAKGGLGDGAWGSQFNLAVTKRLNSKITTHWNAGWTHFANKDLYGDDGSGNTILLTEKSQNFYNLGLSGIFLVSDGFNLMLEGVSSFESDFDAAGNNQRYVSSIINPGFRSAFSIGKVQIVPGLGVPLFFTDNKFQRSGGFIYLSIEPDYTK